MIRKALRMRASFVAAALGLLAITTPQLGCGTSRAFNDNEVKFTQSIFGDQIDTSDIELRSYHPLFSLNSNVAACVPNHNIYMRALDKKGGDDFTDSTAERRLFTHELVHIWQSQQDRNVIREAVHAFFVHRMDYSRSYDYDVTDDTDFMDMGLEQQAELLCDYIYALEFRALSGKDTKSYLFTQNLPMGEFIELAYAKLSPYFEISYIPLNNNWPPETENEEAPPVQPPVEIIEPSPLTN